ncbi:hypothetical protein LK994_11125 [Ferruginibacter lapsinanis]|uniref:hypothetical protein n=1 Tax=Ferruginibacter lapsinanis TaxID=563172 RepID=UPI001E62F446|nr:hypothetical protein [Ferruginibacter lapsinanis]UEG49183.1 hypothetical protein LK994_11125 [Ferruginibacter lapsinanis]
METNQTGGHGLHTDHNLNRIINEDYKDKQPEPTAPKPDIKNPDEADDGTNDDEEVTANTTNGNKELQEDEADNTEINENFNAETI